MCRSPGSPASAMFAVWAPNVIRLVSVRCRRVTGSNTCGKGIARAVWPDGRCPTARRGCRGDGDRQDRARHPAGEAYLAEGRAATVISADSRQVYRGLDIGTAKV